MPQGVDVGVGTGVGADFVQESEHLDALITRQGADFESTVTLFNDWTVRDIVEHLFFWNEAACLSLQGGDAFSLFFAPIAQHIATGAGLRVYERQWWPQNGPKDVLAAWRDSAQRLAGQAAQVDPRARVPWAGPTMSVRSLLTGRLMETWAHGQAVYDVLGLQRKTASTTLQHIATMGVNTFAWSFRVHGLEPPAQMPHVQLRLPDGSVWQAGDGTSAESIQGTAEAFCQVVTQTRNVADTDLTVQGPVAHEWMARAQCFAGPPTTPPAPGYRVPSLR
jgi:uncharacterized protein (TIGR03084 family)